MTSLLWLHTSGPLISTLCGLSAFVSSRKHLLNALLSLEFSMLSIFWLGSICLGALKSEAFLILFFLTLTACEGALGLALLVSVVRTHGNDCFSTFNSLRC